MGKARRRIGLVGCFIAGLLLVALIVFIYVYLVRPGYVSRHSGAEMDIGVRLAYVDYFEVIYSQTNKRKITTDSRNYEAILEIIYDALKRPPQRADYLHASTTIYIYSTPDIAYGQGGSLQMDITSDGICFYGAEINPNDPVCYPLAPIESEHLLKLVREAAE